MAIQKLNAADIEQTKFVLQDLNVLVQESKAELLVILIILELIQKKETYVPFQTFTAFDFAAIADSIEGYYDSD